MARPSDARRAALAAEITLPVVSNFFPIERYYDAAEKLYQSVRQTASDPRALDLCYVYSKRYCMFCIDAIPTHNYYGTPQCRKWQIQHTKQVEKVLSILELVANAMDDEEIILKKYREEQAVKEQQIREQKERERLELWQKRIEATKVPSNGNMGTSGNAVDVQQSALNKLKLLSQSSSSSQLPAAPPPSYNNSSSTRYRFVDSDDDEPLAGVVGSSALPPPIPPPTLGSSDGNNNNSTTTMQQQPSAPPSYDAAVRANQYHPFFGPSGPTTAVHYPQQQQHQQYPSPAQRPTPSPEQAKPRKPLPMRKQQEVYRSMYRNYMKAGKIVVTNLSTYQGRVGSSTNGCTVISALCCARHLNNASNNISDPLIANVIDTQCGPLLRTIRRKLGLGGHSLIIPSDVHDHLVDEKILHQDHFAGAAGGNIMDVEHCGEFLKLLAAEDCRKAAATLFFREHVVSIVKCWEPQQVTHFDLIDSMPGTSGTATRTRCVDMQALKVLLQWYASRKFSDTNCAYIDKNPVWDDAMADLDPRVFQGFVWSTK